MTDSATLRARLDRLLAAAGAAGFDALALNPTPTLGYATGLSFHLMERPVVLIASVRGRHAIVLPELERLKLEDARFEVTGFAYGEDPARWHEAFTAAAAHAGLAHARVGIEPRGLRVVEYDFLRAAAPEARFESADAALAAVRGVKDAAEAGALRAAVHACEAALGATLPLLRLGMTEAELASELVLQLLRAGSSLELPFAPIVSFGENSANPHASPTDRPMRPGDLVLVDWGARVGGYCGDLTRVFYAGEPDAELLRVGALVREANEAAQAVAGPGVPCEAVDAAARGVIERAGYGPMFVHRTGHGLGLEAHEAPYIRAGNTEPLAAGACFTIEPGIYLAGRGGVRIEDDMLVTETGVECLSTLPRALAPIA